MGLRTKLSLGDFGDPAKLMRNFPVGADKLTLGRIALRSSSLITRASLDKTTQHEGLSGEFRMIFSDGSYIESTSLWLPTAWHDKVAADVLALADAKTGDKLDNFAVVETVYDVALVRAKSREGYSWVFQPLVAPKPASPIGDLLARIPAASSPPAKAKGKD